MDVEGETEGPEREDQMEENMGGKIKQIKVK